MKSSIEFVGDDWSDIVALESVPQQQDTGLAAGQVIQFFSLTLCTLAATEGQWVHGKFGAAVVSRYVR